MKRNGSQASRALALSGLAFATTGCEAIQGIFKAGVWVGVILVLAVLAGIVWAIKSFMK